MEDLITQEHKDGGSAFVIEHTKNRMGVAYDDRIAEFSIALPSGAVLDFGFIAKDEWGSEAEFDSSIVSAKQAISAEIIELLETSHSVVMQALLDVVAATQAYLPPDGIDADECLNRILAATDNPTINSILLARHKEKNK